MTRLVFVAAMLGGCVSTVDSTPQQNGPDAGSSGSPDSSTPGVDASTADAPDPFGPWSAPTAIPGANTTAPEDDATLSSNTLELYFKRSDNGNNNLYVMTRATATDAFGPPAPVTALNTGEIEESPRLSTDDLTMWFGRAGDIYMSTRTAIGAPWGAPTPVAELNTAAYEKWAHVCGGSYAIVSRDSPPNGQDLYGGTLGGTLTAITSFNTPGAEQGTLLTPDCLNVYFQSNRDNNQFDIFLAKRSTITEAWGTPTAMLDFNSPTFNEEDPSLSIDRRTFVFTSNSIGDKDIYISTR